MFDRIAPRYDLLNRVLSLRLDARWRRALVRALAPRPGGLYLDVGTGTGDVAAAILRAEPRARVLGLDPSRGMLARAPAKAGGASFALASGVDLPVEDGAADGVASAFVLRNLPDVDRYFRDARRALAHGGRLANLEIGRAEGRLFGPLYRTWFYGVVPRIGRAVSGDAEAYAYLAESVKIVPAPEAYAERLAAAGFSDVRVERFAGGAVGLVSGTR